MFLKNTGSLMLLLEDGDSAKGVAVYDVLAARISKHVVFAGPAKCGGATAREWSAAE
jgi:hypothetical protein